MPLWHITISSVGRQVLFPDEGPRRAAVHLIVRVTRDLVLLFCIVDDHVHVVVACEADRLPLIRGALVQSLARACAHPLISHVKRVESRAHLIRLVAYFLGQVTHHGLNVHPALWSGSCFQDLIGARRVGAMAANLVRALPRLRQRDICRMVGLPPEALTPADDPAVKEAGARRIVAAAASALALAPELRGRTPDVVRARHTAAHLADGAGIRRADLGAVLSLTRQRISQLVAAPADPDLLRATRLQLTLGKLVAASTAQRNAISRQSARWR